jgi:hypothetical protein
MFLSKAEVRPPSGTCQEPTLLAKTANFDLANTSFFQSRRALQASAHTGLDRGSRLPLGHA